MEVPKGGTEEPGITQESHASTFFPPLPLPGPPVSSTHLQAGQVQGTHPRQRWVQEEKSWEEKGMAAPGDEDA